MDILLTQEQEDAAIDAFCERYRKQYGGRPLQVRIDEERRRAHVRKVVDMRQTALDGPCPMGAVAECPWKNCDDEIACRICKASRFFAGVEQALRAAGGEG